MNPLIDWAYLLLYSYFRLIQHTLRLLEEKEEKLCIKVLQTLKDMIRLDNDFNEKV